MDNNLIYTLASSGIAKIMSVLLILFASSLMTEDDFGRFSYAYSFSIAAATFSSYVIGHTWARIASGNESLVGVIWALFFVLMGSASLSIYVSGLSGFGASDTFAYVFSCVLCILAYSGQFISNYYKNSRALFGWMFSSFIAFLVVASVISIQGDKTSVLYFLILLVLIYFLQSIAWTSTVSSKMSIRPRRKGQDYVQALRILWKFALVAAMGAPVHFICISILGDRSGMREVGVFNLSFQAYIAFTFLFSSMQPYLIRYFLNKEISFIARPVFYAFLLCVAFVGIYYSFSKVISCDAAPIICLDQRVIGMCFVSAFLSSVNLIMQQYINSNLRLEINVLLQALYAVLYISFSFAVIGNGVGALGLYVAISASAFLLMVFQVGYLLYWRTHGAH